MNIDSRLFSILAQRNPILYELIPRGPLTSFAGDKAAEVSLNPQPLPPIPAFQLGSALAGEFLQAAWTADRLGLETGRLMDDLDDWCPTVPRKIKLPPWWPPIPDPDPEPNWFQALHIGFAARLSAATIGAKAHALRETVEGAMKRSFDILSSAKG